MSFQLDAMFATLLPADEEIATLYEKILEISASCVSFISFNLAGGMVHYPSGRFLLFFTIDHISEH